ncbi:Gfo/Idh/MocA family protein [Haloferula sp. A504]|uniref:Gfo/Idh/MocA family protein n=1 Tax=Haloferula sp. A504 TaxID=3373601 RepID=UPI0031CB96D5|nr:Gfo/Idh/MocA family oxidoreductase [Verrucomicrobiaceae bacterium E54]
MSMQPSPITRRRFIGSTTATGAGLALAAPGILKAATQAEGDLIHVAIVGYGKQGEVLFNCLKNIPGLYFQAVCDISDYNLQRGVGAAYSIQRNRSVPNQRPNRYTDIDEMLATEKGLDAAIIATPDFWHSPHTVKCLDAGLAVYCEKMMSNTIEGARDMVRAAERNDKLCQIGHQRRSNPRYLFTYEQLIKKHNLCGQIVNANAQWNRSLSASQPIGGEDISPKIIVPQDKLQKYGFENMDQFLNWRFYRDLSGGPISDLGAHQIDIFNWFLGTQPKAVYATGGHSYFKEREHFDNVMACFDYDTPQGEVRAFYQVLTTTSAGGGFWESFMGTEANIRTAEIAATSAIYRETPSDEKELEAMEKKWDDLVRRGYLRMKPAAPRPQAASAGAVEVYESAAPEEYDLPGGLPYIRDNKGQLVPKPAHQPHLENFFAALRGEAKLNCDARHAFESEAPIFYVNPSALQKERIEFTKEQLSV